MHRLILCLALVVVLGAKSNAANSSIFSGLHWRSIGPAVSGGRIPAVAGSDLAPFLYYIGGADGGVFKTTNGGDSWTAVFADKPVASIGAIAIAPSNPNCVWVGTGEGNPRDIVSYGDGVWKSTDGAKHWKHVGLDGTSQITKILVDPTNSNVALVGALGTPYADSPDRGVYRTTDGGVTWSRTLYAGPSTGVSDLSWDPKHPSVIFAGMWQYRRLPWNIISGGSHSALFRSRDGGIHWKNLTGHGLPGGVWGRIGVAVAPNHPDRVYAIIQSKFGYVWRSDDGGDTWHATRATSIVNERPFYFSHLFVDPQRQNHVYALSVQLSQSFDSGETFKSIDNAENVDNHVMWLSSDGKRIIIGHDAGWALSTDGGATWDWRTNVAVGQIYHVGYDLANPYNVYPALQDAESWLGPSNSLNPDGILNRDWLSLNGGDGTWAWPDPLDPHLIWNDTEIGQLWIFDTRTRQAVDVWPYAHDTNAMGVVGLPYRFNWQSPIAFSPQDGHVMYFGGNVVFETRDRGQTWQTISPDLTRNERAHQQTAGGPITIEGAGVENYDTIVDIAPSAISSGEIWVGTDDGLIQLSRDGGATWHNVSPKVEPYGRVSCVEPSHVDAGTAYATVDRHMLGDRSPYILKTEDYGATWRLISSGLPRHDYVHVVREDPRNPNVLYAGLEQGMWISFDRGMRWQSLQADLPTAAVTDLQIQPQANDMIAATLGRSVWILDDITPLQQLSQAKAARTYLFAPRTAYAFSLWEPEQPGWEGHPPLGQFSGENPPYGAMISYYLASKQRRPLRADILDASGRIVRSLDADDGLENAPGIHRITWNLTENPPEVWHGTPKWNAGPDDGAEVVPGTYTVRMTALDTKLAQTVNVAADPRAQYSADQYQARYQFLHGLFAQLSAVDTALNSLDALRHRLSTIRKQAVRRRDRAMLRAIDSVRMKQSKIYAGLTSNPQASQDADFLKDQVRERIQFVIGLLSYGSGYLGPPLSPMYKEASEVTALYNARMDAYHAFMSRDIPSLEAALKRSAYAAVR